MHMWHCDITYDVTASSNDVTSTNKMTCFRCGASKACFLRKWPKMAENDVMYMIRYTQNARCSVQCHTLPHIFGHAPATGAYNCFIYLHFIQWQESYHKNKNKLRIIWTSPTSLATVSTHPCKAQMQASSLQAIQLCLGDVDLNRVRTRHWRGNCGHQQWHLLHG